VTVLFISDLHLTAGDAETTRRFVEFMEGPARAARELYILGDLFEAWIGDDDDDPRLEPIVAALRKLTDSGVACALMHGNRDFLLGEAFCRASGAQLLADPTIIDGTLLMHGDTLCTDDHDYQAWRRTARSTEWQRRFLATPLAERRATVQGLRDKSKEVIQAKPAEIMDVNDDAVREALRRHDVARLIHGHTHRPGKHALEVDGRRCERWVLPDWYGRGGYVELAGNRARLVRW
jgi:UDP-2,3-diacylglucosamine hydrolase